MIRHRQVREAASIAAPSNSAGAVLLTWYRAVPAIMRQTSTGYINAWFGLAYAGSGESVTPRIRRVGARSLEPAPAECDCPSAGGGGFVLVAAPARRRARCGVVTGKSFRREAGLTR